MDIQATKFYIRHRERYPETELNAYALQGMWQFSVEIAPFYWVDDIDKLEDLGPTVGVSGYIDDVWRALKKLGRKPPPNIDYPVPLRTDYFMGREVWVTELGEIRRHPGKEVFIKPYDTGKLFTGFVWNGDEESRRRIVTQSDEVIVWACEPKKFVSEYRCFILDHEIMDVRRYKGSWGLAPSREKLETAVQRMKESGTAPRAYSLDWGILPMGVDTVLVEYNDAYSLGHYGLTPTVYARMLSARWHELTSGPIIETDFKQVGTTSGRLSSAHPNISNGQR